MISKNTKIMLHKTKEEAVKAAKEYSKNAVKIKQQGITPAQPIKNEKGIFGYHLATKKVEFNEDQEVMHPQFVNDEKQKDKKIIDLAVIKRGLNYHGMDAN